MKQFLFLSLIVLSFSACKKESTEAPVIVEPRPEKLLSSDTLRTGTMLGFTIGQPSVLIYTKLQDIRTEKGINNLAIVGNVFTNLDSLANRIPLYTQILLDETIGTSTGIQITFTNNIVSSIYTNDGVKLGSWPGGNVNASVQVGNKREDIYNKLVNIKKVAGLAKKFERISVFAKDVNKSYDLNMSLSPQWYFAFNLNTKQYNRIQLNFTAGKLISIYSYVFETPAD
jgi:hypothetical protein